MSNNVKKLSCANIYIGYMNVKLLYLLYLELYILSNVMNVVYVGDDLCGFV